MTSGPTTWKPAEIAAWERPYLCALGESLTLHRKRAGLTQLELARRSGVSMRTVQRLEHGTRRTRRRTLTYLAAALVGDDGDAEAMTDELASLAGPALAAESAYVERVERRRARRLRKRPSRGRTRLETATAGIASARTASDALRAAQDAINTLEKM